jgi:putative phage-type endonuclease
MTAPTTPAIGVKVDGIDPADALQILPPGAGRQVWLAMRRTGLGGSDASALVGFSRWTSLYELWEDKTAKLPLVDEQSEEAEMGTLLEPVVRDRFARVHNLNVRQAGMFQSTRWPWMLANPDGLASDGRGYEGKTCSPWLAHEWGEQSDPLVPDHAELQAQWCMAVTGLTGWWVACLIGGQRNVYRLVNRDDAMIADLVSLSRDFWFDNVIGGVEPAIDGSAACTAFLAKRFPLSQEDTAVEISADDWFTLAVDREKTLQGEKDAKRDADAVKNRIRKVMGTAERLMCGDDQVATWRHIRKFKEAAFAKAEPELASKYVTTKPVTDVERLAADHPETYRRFCTRELRFTD